MTTNVKPTTTPQQVKTEPRPKPAPVTPPPATVSIKKSQDPGAGVKKLLNR